MALALTKDTFQAQTLAESAAATTAKRGNIAGRKSSVLLWTAQGLVTFIFLAAGAPKLIMPAEMLAAASPLPVLLVRFIGVCELLGAIAMILPGLLRMKPVLTPVAAVGLSIIVTGATIITVAGGDVVGALLPFITLLLALFVAYGRLRLAPQHGRSQAPALRPSR